MHRVCCYLEVRGRFLRPLPQFSRIRFLAGVLVKLVGHQGGTQAGRRAELLRKGDGGFVCQEASQLFVMLTVYNPVT